MIRLFDDIHVVFYFSCDNTITRDEPAMDKMDLLFWGSEVRSASVSTAPWSQFPPGGGNLLHVAPWRRIPRAEQALRYSLSWDTDYHASGRTHDQEI